MYYIDVSINEILNRFIDNYEEKEIVDWTLKPLTNEVHIDFILERL